MAAYTLAEAIVAVLIFTTVTVSFYGGLSYGFSVIQQAREDLRATQILMQKVENLRLCRWSELASCPINFVERYDPIGALTNSGGAYYFGTVTTNAPPADIPPTAAYRKDLCLATVTLYWTNFFGGKPVVHSRTNRTLVARYGLQNYVWGSPAP